MTNAKDCTTCVESCGRSSWLGQRFQQLCLFGVHLHHTGHHLNISYNCYLAYLTYLVLVFSPPQKPLMVFVFGTLFVHLDTLIRQGNIHLPQLLLVRLLADDPVPWPFVFPCPHKGHLASSLSADIPPRHDIYFIT